MSEIDGIRAHLQAALDQLEESGEPSDVPTQALNAVLRDVLAALGATLGECRVQLPYAPLQPVIEADGTLKWCCTHDPNHCVDSS